MSTFILARSIFTAGARELPILEVTPRGIQDTKNPAAGCYCLLHVTILDLSLLFPYSGAMPPTGRVCGFEAHLNIPIELLSSFHVPQQNADTSS